MSASEKDRGRGLPARIGLTGGIGCGKSTALEFFRSSGAVTFEADAVVRELLAGDVETQKAIRHAFGAGVFDSEGKVDRAALAGIVFSSDQALVLLESILHPQVRRSWQDLCRSHEPLVVVEIPLLFENNLQTDFDFTICLSVSPELQTSRLRQRGLSLSQINQRRERQWPLARKMKQADVVFVNEGSKSHLGEQVGELLRRRHLA